MACYYYIKLPKGGEVRIPANSVTITEKDEEYSDIITEINNHYIENKEFNLDSKLFLLLKNRGLLFDQLLNIIENSDKNTLLDNLNKEIDSKPKTLDLLNSLSKNILFKKDIKIEYKGKKSKTYSGISIDQFLERLNYQIGTNYLHSIPIKGLLNLSSVSDLLFSLELKISEHEELSLNYEALSLLHKLIKSKWGNDTSHKMFFELSYENDINDAVVVKSEENQDLIFYNGLNDMSLFMGIFKSIAQDINKDELILILNEYNKLADEKNKIDITNLNSKEFFTGKFVEDSNEITTFIEPEFNKIFKSKKNYKKTIDEIIDLVAKQIAGYEKNQSIIKSNLISLFKFLDTDRYSKGIKSEEDEFMKEYGVILKAQKDLTNSLKTIDVLPLISEESRDYYYKYKLSGDLESPEDMINFINNNIVLYKDLILVDVTNKLGQTRSLYIVPTEIKLTERGILARGFSNLNNKVEPIYNGIVSTKEIIIKGKTVKNAGRISYRKLEGERTHIYQENADKIADSESIIIVSKENKYLPSDLVRDALVRGSEVTFDSESGKETSKIVRGIYPGKIEANSKNYKGKKTEYNISDKKIKHIVTHRSLFEDEFTDATFQDKLKLISDYKVLDFNKDLTPISKDDYILHDDNGNKYNKVLSVTDDYIYILIKFKSAKKDFNYVVKSIEKSKIKKVYKKPEIFNLEEIEKLYSARKVLLNDSSIKNYNYSFFDNYNLSSNGDYILYPKDENTFETYKIVDKDKKLAIVFDLKNNIINDYKYVIIPDNLQESIFVTNRNIYSNSGGNTSEINSIFLTTNDNIKLESNEELMEVKYTIPDDLYVDQLLFLEGSGNLVRGKIITDGNIPEGYKDVTNELINKINNKRNISGKKLYIKAKGNYYVKYNKALYQTEFTREKLNLLDENSFVSLRNSKDPNKTGNKIYKVLGVSNENIILEYNTFSNTGKLLTVIKTLSKDNLDSIKWLFLRKGSINESKLKEKESDLKLQNSKESQEKLESKRKDLLYNIANKFQVIFNLPVEIESVPEMQNKKAYIYSNTDGSKGIILNSFNKNLSEEDLVHEYLHLFLIALKYDTNNLKKYENLLLSYKDTYRNKESNPRRDLIVSSNNISELEEFFVEDLSKIMTDQNFIELDNFNQEIFIDSFISSLKSLQIDNFELNDLNIYDILNSRMSKIFNGLKSKIEDSNLVLFDLNFRSWLNTEIENNNIKIECQ